MDGSKSGRQGVTQKEKTNEPSDMDEEDKAAINRGKGNYELPHVYDDVILQGRHSHSY